MDDTAKGGMVKRLGKEYGDTGTVLPTLRRLAAALWLLVLAVAVNGINAFAQDKTTMIASTGSILTWDGTVIPPFPKVGRWSELQGKSSDRYETRHFMYMATGEPPAMELFVTTDKRSEAPDGAFEMGLVRGYLSGFCGRAGFSAANPIFQRQTIGPRQALCSIVQLVNRNKTLWFYAFIYPREPSLTFMTVRAEGNAASSIEAYLEGLDLR